MKYVYNHNIIEAFRIGVDPIPDWFMDDVTKNKAKLHKTPSGYTYAEIYITGKWQTAMTGNYVSRRGKNGRSVHSYEDFDDNYTPVMEPTPVTAAEPVDPEKEKRGALSAYYAELAAEVKIAYDSFVDVGFRGDEAFAILMKMMENPIKPPKRSKEDVIREFNKWRAERKATKDVEELFNRVNPRKERVNND